MTTRPPMTYDKRRDEALRPGEQPMPPHLCLDGLTADGLYRCTICAWLQTAAREAKLERKP